MLVVLAAVIVALAALVTAVLTRRLTTETHRLAVEVVGVVALADAAHGLAEAVEAARLRRSAVGESLSRRLDR